MFNHLKFKAYQELISRYMRVFKHAWRERRQNDSQFSSKEAEFLPAALSLQESPPSPIPRVFAWLIILFTIIAIIWSIIGRVDIVANAAGKIITTGKSRPIQASQQANLKKIYVKDGQKIKAGDLLVEFDETTSQAEQVKIYKELSAQVAQLTMHQSLLNSLAQGNPSSYLQKNIFEDFFKNISKAGEGSKAKAKFKAKFKVNSNQTASSNASTELTKNIENAENTENLQDIKIEDLNAYYLPNYKSFHQSLLEASASNLQAYYQEYLNKNSTILAQMKQSEATIQSNQKKIEKNSHTLPLIQQKERDLKELVDQDFISKHAYLDQKQNKLEQEGLLAVAKSEKQEAVANLDTLQKQLAEARSQFKRTHLQASIDLKQKIEQLQQDLLKARSTQTLMQIKAPIDGVVQQLTVNNIGNGAVVTPAQVLMVIAPQNDPLEIEMMVENKDIGFVKVGQHAQIKIESFLYTKYGTIDGVITSISNDAIIDEKRGLLYSARVKPSKESMNIDGQDVRLVAGMNTNVEIKTGKRRVIEYFLNPLLAYQKESLKER